MNDFVDFPQTLDVIAAGCEQGQQLGAQVYVSRRGEPLLDAAYGEARPGMPMTSDTINLWLSAGKPLTAVLLGLAREQGRLDWPTPASSFLSEWRDTERESITIEHLLTHTAGLSEVETGWPQNGWDDAVTRAISATPIDGWDVDTRAAYSVAVGWFVLGEILVRVFGRPFDRLIRQELFEPLGLESSWCGMLSGEYTAVADRIGGTFTRGRTGLEDLHWHTLERCGAASPGGNCRGPVRELGRCYEMLLGLGETPRDWSLSAETVQELTRRRRIGRFDETFRHRIDWGLGFIVNSGRYGDETVPYGFGPHASEETFGHGGSQSAIGFADPEHQVVVAWVANGRIGEPKHHRRNRELNTAIYRDLGLSRE